MENFVRRVNKFVFIPIERRNKHVLNMSFDMNVSSTLT